MNLITYTPKDFFIIKQNYKNSENNELDNLFENLFSIKKKKNYFKTEFSIEEKKKNELISYLNKITNNNYNELVKIIYTICVTNNLTEFLIEHIFTLAINQSIYCSYYVQIIKYFLENLENTIIISDYINKKCSEFKKITVTNNIKDNTNLNYEQFCENNKLKLYKKGYSQFLGELFLNKIINYNLIIENVFVLISNLEIIINSDNNTFIEDLILCIEKICSTILKNINKEDKQKIFNSFENIDYTKISMRLKFKILDLKEKL